MSTVVTPDSCMYWGDINKRIADCSEFDSDIILDLSNFINTEVFYKIIIPIKVKDFTIKGNTENLVGFNAVIEALEARTSSLNVIIDNLMLVSSENRPIIDIAKNNLDNTLVFKGYNTIINLSIIEISNNTAISVIYDKKLKIIGSNLYNNNYLYAEGGFFASAIGSGYSLNAGDITITGNNSRVVAMGGQYGTGIGAGVKGSGYKITISGSSLVESTGGYYGCGIGGGFHQNFPGSSGDITICEYAKVNAYGGTGGAGIGGGACFYSSGGCVDSVTIKDWAKVYSKGSYVGSGIGGGFGLGGIGGANGSILILNNAKVTAIGGELATGIGGGYGGDGGNNGGILIADLAEVICYGGKTASAIGGGTSGDIGGTGGNGATIVISDNANVISEVNSNGACIGGGVGDFGGTGGTIIIKNNCNVTTNNLIGYYDKANPSSGSLFVCGGSIVTPTFNLDDLFLSDISACGGGGYLVIKDKDFTPTLQKEYFLKIKLIYPNGIPYTSSLYINNKYKSDVAPYLITPDEGGYLGIYVPEGTYYFSTTPLPGVFYTDTFNSPNVIGEIILLVVPVKKITRGINIFMKM